MSPEWFKIAEIPYDNMWVDKKYWHPTWLEGQTFKAYFLYEGFDKIVSHKIESSDLLL